MRQMNARELKTHLEASNPPPLILDVREPWEYHICHLENSKLVPMNEVPYAVKDLDPGQETIIICHHGVRSHRVGLFLIRAGFKQVVNLSDGIDGWARYIDPAMSTY